MAIENKSAFVIEQAQGAGPAFILDSRFCAGNVFFVNAATGSNSTGRGRTPSQPVATIDYAVGLCTADQGDLIIVMPGHTESITAAAGIACDVSGVKILGVGEGRRRPRITFTTAVGASCDISAARCVMENLVFICGIDAQTAMVNITAADAVVKGCEFQLADASAQAAIGILTSDAADRMILEDNYFHGAADTTAGIGVSIVGTDDILVKNNTLQGYFGTSGAINQATTAGVNHSYIGNYIVNRTADGNNKAIVLKSDTVGIIANNRGAVIDSTSPAPVTAAAAFVSGNYFTGAVDVTASVLM